MKENNKTVRGRHFAEKTSGQAVEAGHSSKGVAMGSAGRL